MKIGTQKDSHTGRQLDQRTDGRKPYTRKSPSMKRTPQGSWATRPAYGRSLLGVSTNRCFSSVCTSGTQAHFISSSGGGVPKSQSGPQITAPIDPMLYAEAITDLCSCVTDYARAESSDGRQTVPAIASASGRRDARPVPVPDRWCRLHPAQFVRGHLHLDD